jgi:hypothetical protein
MLKPRRYPQIQIPQQKTYNISCSKEIKIMKRRLILAVSYLMTIIAGLLIFLTPGQAYTIDANQGTIGTQITITDSGFGSKKGKVLIGGFATKIAKDGWGETRITCEIKKPLPPGPYDIIVKPKEPKDAAPITYDTKRGVDRRCDYSFRELLRR